MSLHIQKFIDRVRGFEARGSKDFMMTMNDAKDLHADITRLLLELHVLREQVVQTKEQEVITVEVKGKSF
jgi:hypothetical protein